jgi:hypothetical protein
MRGVVGMRQVKAKMVKCVMVTFINDKGEMVLLPLYAHRGEWRSMGSYQVFGVSKSDPTFSSVHGLPYRWRPTSRILSAIRRAK